MPVVDSRHNDWSAYRASRVMTNSTLTLGCKRRYRAKPWRRIIIKRAAVQFVCSRLGDERHLADSADVGAVVCHIDTHFLKTFDELDKRSDLRAILPRADADAIDGLVRLVSPASRKSTKRFTTACRDDAWRKCQEVVKRACIQW